MIAGDGMRELAATGESMTKPRPTSELLTMLERELAESTERDVAPDAMPDVLRVVTMLRGAVMGVQRGAAELVAKVHDVVPMDTYDVVRKAMAERTASRVAQDVPRTILSSQLQALLSELGEVEELLRFTASRVEL